MARKVNRATLPATTSVINADSAGGTARTNISSSSAVAAGKSALTGTLTADVLATMLDVTGSGELALCAIYTADTTARTLRLVITIDGTVVYDSTTGTLETQAAKGLIVPHSGYSVSGMPPLRYNASLKIQVASSVSETDKSTFVYILHKT